MMKCIDFILDEIYRRRQIPVRFFGIVCLASFILGIVYSNASAYFYESSFIDQSSSTEAAGLAIPEPYSQSEAVKPKASPTVAVTEQKPIQNERGRVIIVDVHFSPHDGTDFKSSLANCIGMFTFINTRSSHHMDIVFFHNHRAPPKCKGIDTWEGTGVRFIPITMAWFNAQVARLDIDPKKYWGETPKPTEICDFKPLYGYIFYEHIQDYEFWAYGDVDGLFGQTDLFSPQMYEYDIISSYCNTNYDRKPPTYKSGRRCDKGWAAGPLMIIRRGKLTEDLINYAIAKYWHEAFTMPGKKYLDEQLGKEKSLHGILRDKSMPFWSELKQYCNDTCGNIQPNDDMMVYNLIPKNTDPLPLVFEWSINDGVSVWLNRTKLYRIHFLHWSHWKYIYWKETKRFLRKINDQLPDLTCLRLYSLPVAIDFCEEPIDWDYVQSFWNESHIEKKKKRKGKGKK